MKYYLICCINWEIVPIWIQAIGALLASIGLVITLWMQSKTLKAQQKTQEDQRVITKLEQERFLFSRLPILELSDINYAKQRESHDLRFKITIKENYLQNLEIKHNFPENYNVKLPYYIKNVILPKEYKFEFFISFVLEPAIVEVIEHTGYTIIFNFENTLGNKYEQYLFYMGSNNLFIQPAFRKQNL